MSGFENCGQGCKNNESNYIEYTGVDHILLNFNDKTFEEMKTTDHVSLVSVCREVG
jgi:hypothetical protein